MTKVTTNKDKLAYVSPVTSCLSVNYNICAVSASGGTSAGIPAGYGGELKEENP